MFTLTSDNIKFARLYLQLKQEEVATQMGISRATYNRKERGKDTCFSEPEKHMLLNIFGIEYEKFKQIKSYDEYVECVFDIIRQHRNAHIPPVRILHDERIAL